MKLALIALAAVAVIVVVGIPIVVRRGRRIDALEADMTELKRAVRNAGSLRELHDRLDEVEGRINPAERRGRAFSLVALILVVGLAAVLWDRRDGRQDGSEVAQPTTTTTRPGAPELVEPQAPAPMPSPSTEAEAAPVPPGDTPEAPVGGQGSGAGGAADVEPPSPANPPPPPVEPPAPSPAEPSPGVPEPPVDPPETAPPAADPGEPPLLDVGVQLLGLEVAAAVGGPSCPPA